MLPFPGSDTATSMLPKSGSDVEHVGECVCINYCYACFFAESHYKRCCLSFLSIQHFAIVVVGGSDDFSLGSRHAGFFHWDPDMLGFELFTRGWVLKHTCIALD